MKSNSSSDKRKKGFYTALYSGIGAVMVLGLVVSFANWRASLAPPRATYDPYGEDAVVVGADQTQPFMHAQPHLDEALFRPRETPAPTPNVTPPPMPTPLPQVGYEYDDDYGYEYDDDDYEEAAAEAADSPAQAPEPAPTAEPPQVTATFEAFTEADQMLWPVYGDVAMGFSHDRLVYNATLGAWRTNDDLRISAQEGTPVRAAAAGRIAEVGYDREYGNFVRIDNGNGWETIFGQLMDGVLVAEGEIVESGQVIGGVGRPSVFAVLDGHHVSLRVMRDNVLVDPKLVLSELGQAD